MSQLYDSIEPNVIDDEMVQKAIEEQYPEDIGKLAKREVINFKDVTELQLSFRSKYQHVYFFLLLLLEDNRIKHEANWQTIMISLDLLCESNVWTYIFTHTCMK